MKILKNQKNKSENPKESSLKGFGRNKTFSLKQARKLQATLDRNYDRPTH